MKRLLAVGLCVFLLLGCQSRSGNPEIFSDVSGNRVGAVLAYLEAGGDPNLKNRDGDPLLYVATGARGGIEVAAVLLNAGADVNAVSGDGRPILHNAAGWCLTDIVDLLLRAGANPDAKDSDERTAVDVVCKTPQDRRAVVLSLLRETGG